MDCDRIWIRLRQNPSNVLVFFTSRTPMKWSTVFAKKHIRTGGQQAFADWPHRLADVTCEFIFCEQSDICGTKICTGPTSTGTYSATIFLCRSSDQLFANHHLRKLRVRSRMWKELTPIALHRLLPTTQPRPAAKEQASPVSCRPPIAPLARRRANGTEQGAKADQSDHLTGPLPGAR